MKEEERVLRTFWFSDRDKNLFSKEFDSSDGHTAYFEAERYAEENGLQYYHPTVYRCRKLTEKRMLEYGDTKYHTYDCPHLYCRYCKHPDGCRRVDHKTVKMHKSPFSSYHGGESHIPCKDFNLGYPEYADFKGKWQGIEDIWPVYVDAWLGSREPETLTFHLGDDFNTDYKVPFRLFFEGGMIEDGILKATVKQTTVRDRVDLGVQLYKLKQEPIGGVVIGTGEVLPAKWSDGGVPLNG